MRLHTIGGLLVACLAAGRPALAATYYVAASGSDSGPGTQSQPFQHIQKGIDAAADGDTVYVASGTYAGIGNVNLSILNKSVHLLSLGGARGCVIDCLGSAWGLSISGSGASQSVLDGFTIRNGGINQPSGGAGGAALGVFGCSPSIRNCVFENSTVYGLNASASGGGVFVRNGSPTLTSCVVSGNTATSDTGDALGGGVALVDGGSPKLTRCVLSGNAATASASGTAARGGRVYADGAISATLVDCTVTANSVRDDGNACYGGGLYLQGSNSVNGCVIRANQVAGKPTNAFGAGVHIEGGTSVLGRCEINENAVKDYGDTARGGGVMVKAGAAASLTYCSLSRNVITIAQQNSVIIRSAYGAGIHTDGTTSLRDCKISENQMTIMNNIFGAGVAQDAGTLTMTSCSIVGNLGADVFGAGHGAGARFRGGTASLTNCTFVANQLHSYSRPPDLWGVAVDLGDLSPNVTFNNCDFAFNIFGEGDDGRATGIWADSGATATVVGSIFHSAHYFDFRTLSGGGLPNPAAIHLSYTELSGGFHNQGAIDDGHNINADPRFVRNPFTNGPTDHGDLRLQASSPCINAADPFALGLPPYDFDGDRRIQGDAPDMGAYEYGGAPGADLYIDAVGGNDVTGDGTSAAPYKTVATALAIVDPEGRTVLHVKQGNYGSDRPRVTGKVKFVNWTNTGRASIGKQ